MESNEKDSVEKQGMATDFRVRLVINYNGCTHCGACAKACDRGVLEMVNNELVVANSAGCNLCAKCLKRCLPGAISLN